MLGRNVKATVVKPIGFVDENDFTYPLNYAIINDTPKKEYAYILGVDHPVNNFDGKVIAVLTPKKETFRKKKIWIIATKSSRYINVDICEYLDMEDMFSQYNLCCLYENSSGAIVYKEIGGEIRFLLIKNKRSLHWGFPKGHIEKGETRADAARREVLEETGIHVKIHIGFEEISRYRIKDVVDKCVSIFVGTTDNTQTHIQKKEIDDYAWLTYKAAYNRLTFANDKRIINKATNYLVENNFISSIDTSVE